MKTIKEISRQQGNKRRYTVKFDDGGWIGLFDELVIKHGLEVGKKVDASELKMLAEEDDEKKAQGMALRYLGYRSRSEREMELYLGGKGFCEEVVKKTMEKLKGYGYIDDLAFARAWVSHRSSSKFMGKIRLKNELINKGIAADIIDESLSELTGEMEEDQAYKLALKYIKRYRELEPREKYYKLGQVLARRGFSWQVVKKALEKLHLD